MNFEKWLNTLVEEKGIDQETIMEIDGPSGLNMMPVRVLMDAMVAAPAREQAQIKTTLVKIDFINGSVMDFFNHLAKAIAI